MLENASGESSLWDVGKQSRVNPLYKAKGALCLLGFTWTLKAAQKKEARAYFEQ